MKIKTVSILLLVVLFLTSCGKEEVMVVDTTSSWEHFSQSEPSNKDYATVQNDIKEFLMANSDSAVCVESYSGTNTVSFSSTGLSGEETKSDCLNCFMEHIATATKDTEQQLSKFCITITEEPDSPVTKGENVSVPKRVITLSYDTQNVQPLPTLEPQETPNERN